MELARTNPESFGALFDAHYPQIMAYAMRRTGNIVMAEDAVGRVFARALKGLRSFRRQESPAELWLLKLLVKELRRQYRRGPRIPADPRIQRPGAGRALQAEAIAAQKILAQHEQGALAKMHGLPPLQQDILLLHFFTHKKIPEIAYIVGKRQSAVEHLLAREMVRLGADSFREHMQPNKQIRIIDSDETTKSGK